MITDDQLMRERALKAALTGMIPIQAPGVLDVADKFYHYVAKGTIVHEDDSDDCCDDDSEEIDDLRFDLDEAHQEVEVLRQQITALQQAAAALPPNKTWINPQDLGEGHGEVPAYTDWVGRTGGTLLGVLLYRLLTAYRFPDQGTKWMAHHEKWQRLIKETREELQGPDFKPAKSTTTVTYGPLAPGVRAQPFSLGQDWLKTIQYGLPSNLSPAPR